MADTFRLDYVGTKAGIKGAAVAMGYLETGMRVLDAASALLARLQELAVLGANETNTTADADAIDFEAEAIGDEFHRLMTTSTYKGKDVFVATAGSEYVSLGGRDAEMTFGIGDITYTELYDVTATSTSADTTTTRAGRVYKATASVDLSAAGGSATASSGDTFIATKKATGLDGTKIEEVGNHLMHSPSDGAAADTNILVEDIEAVQAKINTARVQAGSQYAALESAVSFTTDLTAQYELGFNTVNDVNFSMETAHLAKNQILQQAATAMLAQANVGQQSLLQLIQG
jgi:flagellin